MGKKLIMLIIVLIIIIAIIAGAVYLIDNTEGGLVGLALGGNTGIKFMSGEEKKLAIECTDPNCIFDNFNNDCKKSYGNVPIEEQEMLVYLEVAGKENDKCILNVKLLDANGLASYAKGLSATCLISPEEVDTITENFDLNEMDCEGALYEAAKLTQ